MVAGPLGTLSSMALFIGLTGGIGSGKSAASAEFEKLGITVVDADVVAREVVAPGQPALHRIAEHFGPEFILADGTLDRARLRARIFSDSDAKSWLEQLLHPIIRDAIIEQLHIAASPYAILVSPLLFETNQHELVARSILVDVPETIQIERASQRDENSTEQIRKIMATQMSRDNKRQRADYILDNSADLTGLHEQVRALHKKLLSAAQNTIDT